MVRTFLKSADTKARVRGAGAVCWGQGASQDCRVHEPQVDLGRPEEREAHSTRPFSPHGRLLPALRPKVIVPQAGGHGSPHQLLPLHSGSRFLPSLGNSKDTTGRPFGQTSVCSNCPKTCSNCDTPNSTQRGSDSWHSGHEARRQPS